MHREPEVARAITVTAAATLLVALTHGVRTVLGMFIGPLNAATGVGFAAVSMALAVSQLVAGVSQPVCGALADRYGPARVIGYGGVLLALGMAGLGLAQTSLGLTLAFALIAAATGAVGSTPVLLSAVSVRVPEPRRGLATGVVGSGASVGQFAVPPLTQASIALAGWASALWGLAVLALAALPLGRFLGGAPVLASPRTAGQVEVSDVAPREAFGEARYWAIAGGFTFCGFHVSFLLAHMPGVIEGCGFGGQLTGIWFSLLGIGNLAGSIGVGFALQRFAPSTLLVGIYAVRAVAVAAFLAAPKTQTVLLVFALAMGVSYIATMPPTAALVSRFYGTRHLGVLFGVVMLTHQTGSFLGVWLGGWAFERYGSFDGIWLLDMVLACAAVAINGAIGIVFGPRNPAGLFAQLRARFA